MSRALTRSFILASIGLSLVAGCNARVNDSGWGAEASEFADELPPVPASCKNGQVDPGEFCHEYETRRAAGLDPCDITVRDFDGDGIDDVAVPNSIVPTDGWGLPCEDCEHVSNVLMGEGNGDLLAAKPYSSGPLLPAGIASGDFNRDGVWDFVTANTYANAITMVHGNGDGTFDGDEFVIDVGGFASLIKAGDLDGDGFADAVVSVDSSVQVVDGGSLAMDRIDYGASVSGLQLADVTGDGVLDLMVALESGTVNIREGEGSGWFSSVANISGAGFQPGSIAAADMDNDGDTDVLVVSPENKGVLFIEQVDGAFAAADIVDVGSPELHAITVADFNSDGRMDIAVSDLHYNDVYVLLQEDGDFVMYGAWKTGERPIAIEVGEFNGDGVPDIAVANQFGNTVTLLNSQP